MATIIAQRPTGTAQAKQAQPTAAREMARRPRAARATPAMVQASQTGGPHSIRKWVGRRTMAFSGIHPSAGGRFQGLDAIAHGMEVQVERQVEQDSDDPSGTT